MIDGDVLRVRDVDADRLHELLAAFGVTILRVAEGAAIPGTHWGEPEAGLIGTTLYLRADTPIHSALHEAGHVACMDPRRREHLDTDAGGTALEECGVCYLQILAATHLPEMGRARMQRDMDAWGYTFRLGSSRAWFEQDAEDARAWLDERGLLTAFAAPV